jgi:hypothetical protein
MILTCSAPICPRAYAAATFGAFGGKGSPVNARRGPNSPACLTRFLASPLESLSDTCETKVTQVVWIRLG